MRHLCLPMLLAATVAALLAAAPASAQRTLDDLRRQFAADHAALREQSDGPVSFEEHRELTDRHAEQLQAWLADEARGLDRINGRLLLTNVYMEARRPEQARAALRALDVEAAPAMELAVAAMLATYLGMEEERSAWIDAALAKQAPFEERMALAVFLATRLEEVELAEQIFTAAAEAAEDDEGRARVGWYRATMIREREDLEDGAYAEALAELARRFPDTYWGGVARDRRRALDLRVGDEAIPFTAPTLDGETLQLADLRGKVVLLDFWTTDWLQDGQIATTLRAVHADYAERGLQIVGVCLDEDLDAARAAAAEAGYTWPQIGDGKGFQNDVALRYAVEQVPYHLLIGRDGRIAAQRLFLQDDAGVRELRGAIEQALAED